MAEQEIVEMLKLNKKKKSPAAGGSSGSKPAITPYKAVSPQTPSEKPAHGGSPARDDEDGRKRMEKLKNK